MKKPRKRRSIIASRAASLKGWRTRRRMKFPHPGSPQIAEMNWKGILRDDDVPTIDLLPKVEWK